MPATAITVPARRPWLVGVAAAAALALLASAVALPGGNARAETNASTVRDGLTVAAPAFDSPPTGPALAITRKQLIKRLVCTRTLTLDPQAPVLLIAGTGLTPNQNFQWNYVQAFAAAERPFCELRLPERGLADIASNAEYVVAAIRFMAEENQRRIAVVGFSQGGMIGRWALKYWPDTRGKVSDLVGLAPSNQGTVIADAVCLPKCAPAIWQQRAGSDFLTALNSGQQTYPGISYSTIYSQTDEIIVPSTNSELPAGPGKVSNVALGEICPLHVADHLAVGTFDPVAYALVLDALTNPGPAQASRIDASVCTQLVHPGVDQETFLMDFTAASAALVDQIANGPMVTAEPALPAYAR
ncbi:MAG: esterase/lipase family protein [Sporichthyaceae bacterium]